MKASKLTDAQKGFIIKQDEDGTPVAEICRKAGISQATYFNWKKEIRRSDAVGDTAPAPGDWSPERLAAPYRLRRQVELAFKRMKSLVGLEDLRAKNPDFARLWINTALLAEDDLPALDPEAPDSLPWPPEPSRSADLAPRRHGHHQHLCRRPAGANPVDPTRLAVPSTARTASNAPCHRTSASKLAPMGLDPRVRFAACMNRS